MRQPVILDLSGAFAALSNEDLVSRHELYGRLVKNFSVGSIPGLVIFTRSSEEFGTEILSLENLQVFSAGPSRNPWRLGKSAARYFQCSGTSVTWIASNPFLEGIACAQAQRTFPGRLQVQAHGNFGALRKVSISLKEMALWQLAMRNFRRADSVRCVSEIQMDHLVATFRIQRNKTFVSPVPINPLFYSVLNNTLENVEHPNVAYVGRIHGERGLEEWVEAAWTLAATVPELKFHIIGDGPKEELFLKLLHKRISPERIVSHGRHEGSTLIEKMSQVSLILNTCKSEAYGRTILESLVLGKPVVAIRSPGADYISQVLRPSRLTVAEAADLPSRCAGVLNSQNGGLDLRLIRSLRTFEETSTSRLVHSWL